MIGILGGAFDPIHLGHLRPALDCLQALSFDELRLVPLSVAVHRPQPVAPGPLRLAMVRAAVACEPKLLADDRELGRPGGSYSFDTLSSLREEVGADRPLCLLVGDDAFLGFLDWHRPLEILDLAHLVVMRRPAQGRGGPAPGGSSEAAAGADLRKLVAERACDGPQALRETPGGRIHFQDVTQLGISSTRIRALVAAGRSPRWLVPDPVLALIEREGLYR